MEQSPAHKLAVLLGRSVKTVEEDLAYLKALQSDSSQVCRLFICDGWLHHDLTRYQRDVWHRIDNQNTRKVYEILPRGHCKTLLITRIWALWQVITMRRRYVVVYSLGERNYSENMDAVWSVLTGPSFKAIQWLYGYYHGTQPPERSGSTITLPGGAKIEFRSILSESRGANDAEAGGRPDLIVFDDIIPTEAAWSQTMRTRIEDRILTMIQPMGGPSCIMRGAGTQIHLDDFVSKCARGIVSGWQTTPIDDRSAIRPDGTVLFPERFTRNELDTIRKEYDSLGKGYLFRREYLNDVNQDESHPLSMYTICVGTPETNTHSVLCVDHSQGVGLDWFVVTQLQRDIHGRTFATVRTRENEISVPQRLEAVERAILLHRPERVIVEDTSESRTFIDILKAHLLSRDIRITIDTPTAASRGDKISFIVGWVEPLCKDGSLICTDDRTRDILMSEMAAFSITSSNNTDDTLDTIAGGVRYLRTPEAPKKVMFAPTGIPQLDRERKRLRDSLTGKKTEAVTFL